MRFAIESWDSFWKDGQELAKANWEMTGEGTVFEPDTDSYRSMYLDGNMVILTVREDGKMLGYLLMILRSSLQSKSIRIAGEEGLYLDPVARRGTIGIQMIKMMNQVLKSLGVEHVYYSSRPIREITPIFQRLGFTKVLTRYKGTL